jgi:hypothetical protein
MLPAAQGTIVLGLDTDSSNLASLAFQNGLSRIVVANPDILRDTQTADALLDLRLRGVKIERAADSFERENQKVWIEGYTP